MSQAHDPFDGFLRELADYDAVDDIDWSQSTNDDLLYLNASIHAKLGIISPPSLEVTWIVEQAKQDHWQWFSQQQIIQSCHKHDQLEVLKQNGFNLVGSPYFTSNLVYPHPQLAREGLRLFIAEMWGQWVEIPESGWEVTWELELVSDTECILHPYIPSLYSFKETDPADDVYVLHETITEALGLNLLTIPL